MGTNFYVTGHGRTDDPKWHLGKRSAAGYYCWDCGISLCMAGEERVHYGKGYTNDDNWYKACPKCGKKPTEESLDFSSAGRELGFNKTKPKRKTGVASCSSFTWARKLGKVQKIKNEYGDEYTREEFEQVLLECPIQFNHMLGQWFS